MLNMIVNLLRPPDTIIEDHVWVCPGSKILKGTKIGDGYIVGNTSLVCSGTYPDNSFITGVPAKVVRSKYKCRVPLS
jgi:acetyltransferase-like isoleucine patch superfamily enzyme